MEPADIHHLKAAEGWLELGNDAEAFWELESVNASLRSHPVVLRLRWQIYARAGKWEWCADIARSLVASTELEDIDLEPFWAEIE